MKTLLRIFGHTITAAMFLCGILSEQAYCGQKRIRFKPTYAKNRHGLTTAVQPDGRKGLRIGLALAGGGARAAAAIGVLKVLEEEGIPVSAIAGTSMGALVGGLYAAGNSLEDIEGLILDNAWIDVFRDTPARAFLTQEQKEAGSRHLL
ncbi:MAG TPA: hypothetical protein DCO77_08600 [Nitrospiraceae bacterium]|nr:hypothetical protein [Nitrospiraceae bacterium]